MATYQRARAAARDEYMAVMKPLESAKGSAYYDEQRERAMRKRNEAVAVAQIEARHAADTAIARMRDAINNRQMPAPSEEAVRILQVLKMRDKPTRAELQTAANAMGGNALALAILNDIARANELPVNFSGMATAGLAPETATEILKDIARSCGQRIDDTVGANRAVRMAKEMHARQYGGAVNLDDLPQEAPYQSEQDFYSGMVSVPYDVLERTLN